VAAIVGATGSLGLAMMVPGALMILAFFFTSVLKDDRVN
jgi:hypothetical protein